MDFEESLRFDTGEELEAKLTRRYAQAKLSPNSLLEWNALLNFLMLVKTAPGVTALDIGKINQMQKRARIHFNRLEENILLGVLQSV